MRVQGEGSELGFRVELSARPSQSVPSRCRGLRVRVRARVRVWPWQLGTVDVEVAHEPEDALDPVVVPARREGGRVHRGVDLAVGQPLVPRGRVVDARPVLLQRRLGLWRGRGGLGLGLGLELGVGRPKLLQPRVAAAAAARHEHLVGGRVRANANPNPNPTQTHMLLFEGATANATRVDAYVSTRCADGELVHGQRRAPK